MATKTIKTTIIPRKDTYANWTASTAGILALGEFGLDTTNNVLKCGDGTSTWANLPELNETTLSDLGITATATELNYVDGVTSAIQTQLNAKAPKSHASSGTTYGVGTASNYGHVKIQTGDMKDTTNTSGIAAGLGHTHSDYASASHTHNYAGSSSAGGAATSANKVNTSLAIKLNSGTTEGTNLFTFNGSTAKTVNITPSSIGAATSGHTHSNYASSSHTHSYDDLTDKPTIPTKVSELTNDSGFTKNTGTVTSVKIAAGTGLSVDSTSAITTSGTRTLSLAASGVTADTYGPSANVTGTDGATIVVPEITVDTYGRVTSVTERTYTSKDTNTTYESKTAASGGTTLSLVTTGEKYTWNNKSNLSLGTTATTAAKGNHTHTTSMAESSGTSTVTLASGKKYALNAGGTSVIFTMPTDKDTTYDVATTSANGLMSSTDKTKLDGIATGATKVTTDTVAGWGYTKNAGTVTSVKVGSTSYNPSSGVVSLPAYPTVPTSLKSPYSLGIKVNSETSAFVSYDGSAAKTLTIAPSSTAGAFTISDGSTTKTIQLAGKFTDNNTNYYHTSGSWSGLTYTATANGGAGALAFTIPTGTSATTVAVGNHTHDYSNVYAAKSHTHSDYLTSESYGFGKVVAGNTTITADAVVDTLTLVAGTGITITGDATNDKVTIATNIDVGVKSVTASGTGPLTLSATTTSGATSISGSIAVANGSQDGYMPKGAYSRLYNIYEGATKNSITSTISNTNSTATLATFTTNDSNNTTIYSNVYQDTDGKVWLVVA